MTDDASDVICDPVVSSDSKMSEQTVNSNTFRKPVSLGRSEKQVKCKSSSRIDKDAAHSELKKKKKKNKFNSTHQNRSEVEDATESVDSGCIADIAGEVTDWPQVETAVLEERNYILSLLQWLPDFEWDVPALKRPKPSSDDEESSHNERGNSGGKTSSKKKAIPLGTRGKLKEFLNEGDEIDSLRERYTEMLKELKKGRGNSKKQGKVEKKLKNLNRRNKKNSNRQKKLEHAEIYENKCKVLNKARRAVQRKKIFNEKGKLVFSKFDFSTDGSGSQTTKAKNLEYKVAQAIKEREMRKRLKNEGDLKGSTDMKEIQAWSSALQRADGERVRDDLGMLQKSLKKKEYRKKLNKKRWEDRTSAVEKKMNDRQIKRKDNLNARREKKLEKQGKKFKKKGHMVPGF